MNHPIYSDLTAENMRKVAEETKLTRLNPILEKIYAVAKSGGYNVTVYENVEQPVRDRLETLGYKVGESVYDQREGDYFTNIDWI